MEQKLKDGKQEKGPRNLGERGGRPLLFSEPCVSVSYSITPELREAVVEAAKRAQMSPSAWVRMILSDRLLSR